jgi:hypothetical protein
LHDAAAAVAGDGDALMTSPDVALSACGTICETIHGKTRHSTRTAQVDAKLVQMGAIETKHVIGRTKS